MKPDGGITFVAIPYEVFTDPNLAPTEKLAMGRLAVYAGKDSDANRITRR